MITLFTGLPGAGKTLFGLVFIKAIAESQKREVFYSGITILDKVALPWTEFKAEDWWGLPDGAIIVIDEAQFSFGKKPNGSKLPDYYEKLATHRHKGFDIFITTQHPSLLDNFVRQLVGQHFHSVRKFGFERSTVYEWSAVNALPQSASSQKAAIPRKFSYPKEVYKWYKSAEVHTVKKAIPMKIILAVVFIVAMVAFAVYALNRFTNKSKDAAADAPAAVAGTGIVSPGGGPGAVVPFDSLADARRFAAVSTPRVEGLQFTAPKYDEITKPTSVPVPAMCVQIGSVQAKKEVTCKCYSQQATRLDVPFNMCIEFARYGFFREFNPDRDRQQSERTEKSVQALSGVPDSGPMVLTIPDMVSGSRIASAAAPAPARAREERSADVPGPGGVYVR